MSAISSSVGLISGLPIAELVESLLSQQKNSITLIDNRVKNLTALRTALLDINARVLSFNNSIQLLKTRTLFNAAAATSSNESVLRVTADSSTATGQYSFVVRQLASSYQAIAQGFAARDQALQRSGTLTIESAAARLDSATALSGLRGGAGIRAGRIRITDRSGAAADIDLSAARTVDDVVSAINRQTTAAVRARVDGDRLVLEDQTGLSTGTLTVTDVSGGFAAADLGLAGSSAGGTITGADLVYLSGDLRLSALNDGNGVRRNGGANDFRIDLSDGTSLEVDLSGRLTSGTALALLNGGTGVAAGSIRITNRAGQSADVDLSGASTVSDVLAAVNAAGIGVTASVSASRLLLSDSSTGTGTLAVTEIDGGTTARDLGLTAASSGATLQGATVYRVDSLNDAINAINLAAGNNGRVAAAISADGERLELTDNTGGGGAFSVSALNDSLAAADLGLLGRTGSGGVIQSNRLLSGLSDVLLRNLLGGQRGDGAGGVTSGVQGGVIRLTDRAGVAQDVDLTGAQSLAEVISAINAAGTGIRAAVSDTGLGIVLTDQSQGAGALVVQDVSGDLATRLGIAFNGSASSVQSGNLQRKYVSEESTLEQLGIQRGKFRITNSAGQSAVVDLTQGDEVNLQDVIDEINSRGIGVKARINDSGDGLLLTDSAGGAAQLRVTEEEGGSTAKSLRLAGEAKLGTSTIDGSREVRVDVAASDTLDGLLAKIRAAGGDFSASVINDGSGATAYRLTIASARSGASGRLAIDGGATGLNFSTLTQGRDAVVQVGGADGEASLIVTSSTNTVTDVVPGLKLELVSASEQAVSVTVSEDRAQALTQVKQLVETFNAVLARLDELSTFNADTGSRGVLLGDRSAEQVRSALTRAIGLRVGGLDGGISRLSSIGIKFSNGRLQLDESKFNQVIESQPEAVADLFTLEDTGLSAQIADVVKGLTDTTDGALGRRDQSIDAQVQSLEDRKTQLNTLLEGQRQRLLSQFYSLESVLAKLQSQQTALGALSTLAAPRSSSSSGSSSGS